MPANAGGGGRLRRRLCPPVGQSAVHAACADPGFWRCVNERVAVIHDVHRVRSGPRTKPVLRRCADCNEKFPRPTLRRSFGEAPPPQSPPDGHWSRVRLARLRLRLTRPSLPVRWRACARRGRREAGLVNLRHGTEIDGPAVFARVGVGAGQRNRIATDDARSAAQAFLAYAGDAALRNWIARSDSRADSLTRRESSGST